MIVGLGNPGPTYAHTRHNVGFAAIEAAAASSGSRLRKPLFRRYARSRVGPLYLAIPLTYMNRSGAVLPELLSWSGAAIDQLLVVCDNMDLPVGSVRIKRKGSATHHNGLASIMDALGTGDFARLYIGIGRPVAGVSVVDHVLGTPADAEQDAYESAVATAGQAIHELQTEELDTVINRVHARGSG